MADPVAAARVDPFGVGKRPLHNGFSSFISFSADPDVGLFERAVQPPGIDGGDPIDVTTMFNDRVRPKAARHLVEGTSARMRVGYDPDDLVAIEDLINAEGSVTLTFPNGTQMVFWGWLKSFTPQEYEDGVFPEAECEIVFGNWDPNNCIETNFIISQSNGTC